MNLEEMKKFACQLLKVDDSQTISYKEIDKDKIYFYQNFRGGSSVIISKNGTFLFATSAISFEKHLEEFKNGRRSKPVNYSDYNTITNNKYGFSFSIPSYFKEENIEDENIIYNFVNENNSNEKLVVEVGKNEEYTRLESKVINDENKFEKNKYLNVNNHLLMYTIGNLESKNILLIYNLNSFLIAFKHISDKDDYSVLYNILNSINQFDTEYSMANSKESKEVNVGTNPFNQ